jgi:hypothetical protein
MIFALFDAHANSVQTLPIQSLRIDFFIIQTKEIDPSTVRSTLSTSPST